MIKTNDTLVDYSTIPKNSYVAFDAISLRNLIIERLNDKNIFTDQNYIGSNLASIIDIISFSFNTLLFYLNRTSTESMFSEAQLYENINRIVKLLDYKPVGYQTSTLSFQISANSSLLNYGNFFTIPRYSFLTIGGIPFSFNEDIAFSIPAGSANLIELSNISNTKLLYQGVFKESPIYTPTGSLNETFVLNAPDTSTDHFNIHVYVYEHKKERWVQYTEVPNMYAEEPYATVYEKRLNSDKLYEISFGDGIAGRKLEAGDRVVIYYLQSSGVKGIIGPNVLQAANSLTLFDTVTFNSVYDNVKQEKSSVSLNNTSLGFLTFANSAGSTLPKEIESTDSIRKNAPANFKSQYRLVTQKDYETFIKINHSGFISDIKTFSNWEYMSMYLKYFNDIQISPTTFKQIAFNQVQYADACNFNNIYVCAVPKSSINSSLTYLAPAQKDRILASLQSVKMLTTEVNFIDPIYKAMAFGIDTATLGLLVDDKQFCKVELVKSPNSNRTNESLIADATSIVQKAFSNETQVLGNTLNLSEVTSMLLQIEGVAEINTARIDTGEKVSGLSVFFWNPTYPDLDRKVVRNNIVLQPFEFLYFERLANVSDKFFVTESATGNVKN